MSIEVCAMPASPSARGMGSRAIARRRLLATLLLVPPTLGAAALLASCGLGARERANLEGVKARASRYWLEKYGEELRIERADYERELYAGTDVGSYRVDDIRIDTADGHRVFYNAAADRLADNRQAGEIQRVLRDWLSTRLEEARREGAAGNLELAIATLDSERWRLPDPDDPSAPAREPDGYREPIFNLTAHAPVEADETWSAFATHYDGVVDAFIDAAGRTGELAMPRGGAVFLGYANVDGSSFDDLPMTLEPDEDPAWLESAKRLVRSLDDTFSSRPSVRVGTEGEARHGYIDTIGTFGWFEARSEGGEPVPPVLASFVALAEDLWLASGIPGLTLHQGEARLDRLETVTEDRLNEAMAALGDYPVTLASPVWRIALPEHARSAIDESVRAGAVDTRLLLIAKPAWADRYGAVGDRLIPEEQRGREHARVYTMEVAGIGPDGRLEVGGEGTSYGLDAIEPSEAFAESVRINHTGDEILLFAGTEHRNL